MSYVDYLAPEDAVSLGGKRSQFLSLPKPTRTAITEVHLPRLRRIRLAIAADADLQMPPIQVLPWAIRGPDKSTIIYAQARGAKIDGDHFFMAVLPASSLFCIDSDDLLRKLICHEFGHCFWYATQLVLTDRLDLSLPNDWTDTERFLHNARIDGTRQIDPARWFGAADTRNFMAHHDVHTGQEMDPAAHVFDERCRAAGLPMRICDLDKQPFHGLMFFPKEILERAYQCAGLPYDAARWSFPI